MNWSSEWGKSLTSIGVDLAKPNSDLTAGRFVFKDGHKARTIDVIIVGDLGLDFDNDGWNIYHIPTLSCFSKAVPSTGNVIVDTELTTEGYSYTKEELLSWMKKVQENYPTSWQMLRLLTPENFKDKGDSAKEIIQKWCLSVPVSSS